MFANAFGSSSSSDKEWKDVEKRSEALGIIKFRVKRRSVDREYVATKRQEVLDLLKTQVETVERFNREYRCSGSSWLSSDVRGIDGITLLYAAVELMADSHLVRKILALGGDPRKPSPSRPPSCDTPLELARMRYQRCRSKETDASASGNTNIVKAARETSARAKQLLDVLEQYKC